jgi:hypothetical protein
MFSFRNAKAGLTLHNILENTFAASVSPPESGDASLNMKCCFLSLNQSNKVLTFNDPSEYMGLLADGSKNRNKCAGIMFGVGRAVDEFSAYDKNNLAP